MSLEAGGGGKDGLGAELELRCPCFRCHCDNM